MRYMQQRPPARPLVMFAGGCVRVVGASGRLRPDDIHHALRAVLWRLDIGDDPEAVAAWDKWVSEHAPAPRSWGVSRPLTVSLREALEARRAA